MRQPRRRVRREVDVVVREQLVVALQLVDLDQPALGAGQHLEREVRFGAAEVFGAQEGVRGRRRAEVDEHVAGLVERRRAMAALHARTPSKPAAIEPKAAIARRQFRSHGPRATRSPAAGRRGARRPRAPARRLRCAGTAARCRRQASGSRARSPAGSAAGAGCLGRARPHASARRWASRRADRPRHRRRARAGSGSASLPSAGARWKCRPRTVPRCAVIE